MRALDWLQGSLWPVWIPRSRPLAASALSMTNTVNLADRSYFQRALSSRAFSIGDYQVGRISGKPSFDLGYPVFAPSGRIQAVVFAALDLDWVNRSDRID